MKSDVNTSIRMPAEYLDRAHRLIKLLNASEVAVVGDLTQSKVLRIAIDRGLASLEKEFGRRRVR